MMTVEQRFRRNFTMVCVAHAVVIVGLVLFEYVRPSSSAAVPVFMEADILGELPKGPTPGRGAYAPSHALQSLTPGGGTVAEQAEPVQKPAPRNVPSVKSEPLRQGEIAVPKSSKADRKTKPAVAKAVEPTGKKPAVAKASSTKSRTTGAGGGPSAADIRNKFAKALATEEGGTPYGDGKAAGGGNGHGRIGSPNGAENGVVGGVGKGTPFWWYYEHVHDKMYEAWEQPSDAVNWDRSLMATIIISVARDGRIVDARLKGSSGNKSMDESALAAAKRVRQLQPLPDGLDGNPADISVNFSREG